MKPMRATIHRLKRVGIPADALPPDDGAEAVARNQRTAGAAESVAAALRRPGKAPRDRIESLRREVTRLGTDVPPRGEPGQIAVRVVGVRGQKEPEAFPLGGMTIDAEFGEGEVVTAVTDPSGMAVITAPAAERSVEYTVRAIGSDGNVAASKRGRLTGNAAPSFKLEVGFRAALAPEFAQGQKWQTELTGLSRELDVLERQAAREVQLQVEGLRATARRLKEAVPGPPDRGGGPRPFEGIIRVPPE